MNLVPRPWPPSRGTIAAAIVCGLIGIVTLLSLVLLDSFGDVTEGVTAEYAALVLGLDRPRWWILLALLIVQVVLLLGVQHRPRVVLVAMVALSVVTIWVSPDPGLSLWTPTLIVAVYAAAVQQPIRDFVPTLIRYGAIIVVATIAVQAYQGALNGEAVLVAVGQGVLAMAIPAVVAAIARSRRELQDARRLQREAEDLQHDAERRAAVSRERAAMARELHDIAAHHLSGMALTTAAIQRLVDTDPERAKSAAGEVREQTTMLLQNLRRLVGLLREDDVGETGSSPTVAEIDALVAGVRATGVDVTLTLRLFRDSDVPGRGVGPLAQLAAYRAVQESLANAIRHSPGALCTVLIDDTSAETLRIEVENGPASAPNSILGSGGFGLVGMQERAELTGSVLDYGPRADGGWRVSLVVPRDDMEETMTGAHS